MAKLIIARPVSGTLVVNGAPVAGTQLVRRWHWHLTDERGEETTTTGADGRFTFDAVERRKPIWGYFPHEPVIQMEFLAMRGDGLAPLVICSRRRYDLSREDRCAEKDNAPYQIRFDQSGNGQS